jgi:hypothetical protein
MSAKTREDIHGTPLQCALIYLKTFYSLVLVEKVLPKASLKKIPLTLIPFLADPKKLSLSA